MITEGPLRYVHISDVLSDLYNHLGEKVGSISEASGRPVLYTSSVLQLTVPGLLQLVEALQKRHAEYEYGS